jgi:hypothetical protein
MHIAQEQAFLFKAASKATRSAAMHAYNRNNPGVCFWVAIKKCHNN